MLQNTLNLSVKADENLTWFKHMILVKPVPKSGAILLTKLLDLFKSSKQALGTSKAGILSTVIQYLEVVLHTTTVLCHPSIN